MVILLTTFLSEHVQQFSSRDLRMIDNGQNSNLQDG